MAARKMISVYTPGDDNSISVMDHNNGRQTDMRGADSTDLGGGI